MEKDAVKLVVFNDQNFDYWKNRTRNYLLSQRLSSERSFSRRT
jgi:hypothetical protein